MCIFLSYIRMLLVSFAIGAFILVLLQLSFVEVKSIVCTAIVYGMFVHLFPVGFRQQIAHVTKVLNP